MLACLYSGSVLPTWVLKGQSYTRVTRNITPLADRFWKVNETGHFLSVVADKYITMHREENWETRRLKGLSICHDIPLQLPKCSIAYSASKG
jgi:hypothetical protein